MATRGSRRRRDRLALGIALTVVASMLCFGCAHLDPYEHIGDKRDPTIEAASLLPDLTAAAVAESSASGAQPIVPSVMFVGALPNELSRVEARRRALIATLRQISDERTYYNASVWTLAPMPAYGLVHPGMDSIGNRYPRRRCDSL